MDVDGSAVLNDGWDKPWCARQQAVCSQKRDGYEVQRCGRGGGGSEVWLHSRLSCACEAGCEVLVDHDAGSNDNEDRQSRHCCAPIVGVTAARP